MSMPLPSGHLSPLTRRNEFPALQSSSLVELALLPLPSRVTYEHAAPFWASEFPHSEEWVPRSPELLIGRASTASLAIEGSPMSMPLPSGHLSSLSFWRNEFSAPQSSLSVELALLPSPRGSPKSMPLPSERLSSLSFWGMSSPLPRALW